MLLPSNASFATSNERKIKASNSNPTPPIRLIVTSMPTLPVLSPPKILLTPNRSNPAPGTSLFIAEALCSGYRNFRLKSLYPLWKRNMSLSLKACEISFLFEKSSRKSCPSCSLGLLIFITVHTPRPSKKWRLLLPTLHRQLIMKITPPV